MLTIKDAGTVEAALLPVAELAAQMRLADEYDAVPGQAERLAGRLRAAMGMVERKLGQILVERDLILSGPGPDGRRIVVPLAPIAMLGGVEVVRPGDRRPLDGSWLEYEGRDVVLVVPETVPASARLDVVVTAGFGFWNDVPDELRQAVLLTAEALDEGREELLPLANQLMAGHRDLRIGGRV